MAVSGLALIHLMWEDGARGWADKRIRIGYGWGGICVRDWEMSKRGRGPSVVLRPCFSSFQKYAFGYVKQPRTDKKKN